MGNLLFWLGIGAAQKGAGSKPLDRRHRALSFAVGTLLALLIAVGMFLLLVSQRWGLCGGLATIAETKRDGDRHAGCWAWWAGNVISARLSARGNRTILRHRAVSWPCYAGSCASLDWEGRFHVAGEGDARSSAELAVKHVS